VASTGNVVVEGSEPSAEMGTWNLQRIGGIAALTGAAIYVAGILYFLVVLDYANVTTPLQQVELFAANETGLYAMNFLIYVVFGVVLVALVLALHDRLGTAAPTTMQAATAFGLIWAGLVIASGMISNIGTSVVVDLYSTDPNQAAATWLAISPVVEGLGGGNEIVGGVWTLLVSVVALRAGMLHRALNYLGIVVGLAGIVSAVPALGEIGGGVFGLTQIVWFVGLGLVLLRTSRREIP
jgi:hypothetical protein